MDQPTVSGLAERQRAFFRTGTTRDVTFRRRQLGVLRNAIVERGADLIAALKADLGRPAAEAYTSEIAVVLHEIDFASRHLASWARPRKVRTPLILFPGSSWIHPEPYGRALIISPWNYPFQLAVAPLVAALAAGNCAVVKPSEVAPRTSALITEMLTAAFEPDYVAVVEGGAPTVEALLAEQFDFIFFTGGPRVGRIVMAAAAKNLTPVVLELGGKNPCIVDSDADLDTAARRIAWGKFVNAGQTCIAPDFVLAHASIRAALLERLAAVIESFFGKDPQASPDYGRIINDHHVRRLAGLLGDGNITVGGRVDTSDRYIAPTVLDNISWDAPIMQEEIFGPILPVLTFDDLNAAIEKLQQRPKPLALYFFSGNRMRQDEVLRRLSAGGACINDTLSQMLNLRLPFGGVGESGMGAYHGKGGFDAFGHAKAVVRRGVWADPSLKYPPYRTPLATLRTVMRFMF